MSTKGNSKRNSNKDSKSESKETKEETPRTVPPVPPDEKSPVDALPPAPAPPEAPVSPAAEVAEDKTELSRPSPRPPGVDSPELKMESIYGGEEAVATRLDLVGLGLEW